MKYLIDYEGVCRTAPATLGLLKTSFFSRIQPVTGQVAPSQLPPPSHIPVSATTHEEVHKQKIKKKVLGPKIKTSFAQNKLAALEKAKLELQKGVHTSVHAAAQANSTTEVKIARTTLVDYIRAPPGKAFHAKRGRISTLLTPDQEQEVVMFMRKRAELGSGLNFRQAS